MVVPTGVLVMGRISLVVLVLAHQDAAPIDSTHARLN